MSEISARNVPVASEKRLLVGLLLLLLSLALIGGGGWLLSLGGSAYYLFAGIAVGLSGALLIRGDARGIWVYAAMLLGTLLWALWEAGLNGWAIQARLFAPAVLGVWVGWPWLRRLGRVKLAALALIVALPFALWIYNGNRNETVTTESLPADGPGDWPQYAHDLGGSRFSPLTQINASNIGKLKLAWSYRTGVPQIGIGFETTPLMLDNRLYLCTQNNIIIALDPETGQQVWRVDPKVDAPAGATCRGVAHHAQPGASGLCAKRIIAATTDGRMLALDAATGAACHDFGDRGTIDLKRGLGEVGRGYYYVSSAPTIVNGNAIVGGWVLDNQYVGEPSGVVRGFDVITGKLAWAWDMDRPDRTGEPPAGETYTRGTANSWAPMSGDEKLGLVYLPTGNATPDYWGGRRSAGSERYASGVVALDASTGKVRWNFQTVHHDLWDYDVASQPVLIDLPIGGKNVPALIQATKQGQVFLLDRRTGAPLSRVVEKPVAQKPSAGDFNAPTQPFSVDMPAFDNTILSERSMWGTTPLDQLWCRIKFRQARYSGQFTPPNIDWSIFFPGYMGGVDWGSVAVDPERHLMVANWSRIGNYMRMLPRSEAAGIGPSTDGAVHAGQPVPQGGTPFAVLNGPFLSPLGVPCTEPPFGKIAAVDLVTRKVVWERPLGTSRDSGPFNIRSRIPLPMGVPNTGGALTTRAGLVFIGATQERAFRAFDIRTGKKLWSADLPAGGNATPMTYISPKTGRQFVVIGAGGSAALVTGNSDHIMAYALPAK